MLHIFVKILGICYTYKFAEVGSSGHQGESGGVLSPFLGARFSPLLASRPWGVWGGIGVSPCPLLNYPCLWASSGGKELTLSCSNPFAVVSDLGGSLLAHQAPTPGLLAALPPWSLVTLGAGFI